MPLNRDELLRHRRLVHEHLTWLDAQLQQLDSSPDLVAAGEHTPQEGEAQSVETVNTAFAPATTAAEPVARPIQREALPIDTAVADPYLSRPQNLVTGSFKFGCWAVVILACLLFLFVIFVLPEWLY